MQRPPYPSSHLHSHSYRPSSNFESSSSALERVLSEGFDDDDMDCPLCLEEMDISDLNFKPCPCGYQICRFCWHHIKENLNGLCPACRAPYDDETVEFKAIKPDELKRLQAAKKIRDKRRKDDALTVKNMANIRVRQRAQVHVQGMTTKIANEDTLNQLKGTEQFGQYGKVIKLFMSKRSSTVTQPASTHPHYQPVNVYVNYRTAAEASNCIAAIDGSTTGDGHKLKAIWGTTRYCPTYLKGGKCNNENCMQAHEPGEEIEGAGPTSREEMLTYHAMSDTDTQRSKASNAVTQIRKQQEAATLPPTASWATKNALNNYPVTPIVINSSLPPLSATLPKPPPPRPIPVAKPQNHPLPARPSQRAKAEPAVPATTVRLVRPTSPEPPAPSALDSPRKPSPIPSVPIVAPVASTSTPSPPPIFSDLDSAEPYSNGTAHLTSIRSIARPPSVPFPELDFGGGAFSFSLNLDVKGKGKAVLVPGEETRSARDFANLDGFGRTASPSVPPPTYSNVAPSYMGSFDPFSDTTNFDNSTDPHSGTSSPPPSADEMSRRSSRFGFARRESNGMKPYEFGSAIARSAFSGRESPGMGTVPFAPPGIGMPSSQGRPGSSGFNPFGPSPVPSNDSRDTNRSVSADLWTGGHQNVNTYPAAGLPPALLRTFALPTQSATSSPQMSPRARAGMGYGNGGGPTTSLPPGISLNQIRTPQASAASFPLPPPAPRAPGISNGGTLGKDDLFALIAAAQASAPKAQPASNEIYPFNDPAILNARLAPSHYSPSNMATGPPPSAAYHSLDNHSSPQPIRNPVHDPRQFYQNQIILQQQQQQQQQQQGGNLPYYPGPPRQTMSNFGRR